jgi:transcriptional regulator with XRE-family HTH domain
MSAKNDKLKIGKFIANLRQKKNFTQSDLASILETTRESVALMESGQQNFTTELLRLSITK